jgi:hypothetical protein
MKTDRRPANVLSQPNESDSLSAMSRWAAGQELFRIVADIVHTGGTVKSCFALFPLPGLRLPTQ